MRIVRFAGPEGISYGVLSDHGVRSFEGTPFDKGWSADDAVISDKEYPLDQITLLTPCTPTKYLGVGINHVSAAKAKGIEPPAIPIVFMKPLTAVVGPNYTVYLHEQTEDSRIVFEGELLVVIGKEAFQVSADEALNYVLGYSCANDVTDIAKTPIDMGNPTRAKSYDTFGPIGPCIATDIDPTNARIITRQNGKVVQDDTTAGLIFSVSEVISFFSKIMTLLPGDVIATGTPAGTSRANSGDVIEVCIEGIGTLRNTFLNR